MKTEAVIFTCPGQVEVGEVELPALRSQDVLIRTEWSFISTGTERWILWGQLGKRWGRAMRFPLVPGYQKVGWVEEVGPAVTRIQRGQRVFMTTGRTADIFSESGGHMRYAVEDEAEVYDLPEQMPSEVAAGLVVVQVGWNTGHRPTVAPGDLAVIIGDGIIGQFTAQALHSQGAEVWLAGRHSLRLELGQQWSCDRTINTYEEDLLAAVQAARPKGADVVVETVCRPEDTPMYVQMLRQRGQLVIAAYHPDANWVDLSPIQDKQLTIHSTGGWTRDQLNATIVDIVGGKFHVDPLITHRVPWREAAAAYERLVRDKAEDSLGIVIDWR